MSPSGRSAAVLLAVCVPAAGCASLDPREATMTDRCVAVMKVAYVGEFEITSRLSHAEFTKEPGTIVVDLQGRAPKGNPPTLGLQCTFRNSILMSIRWTEAPSYLR
jgi:hypothetical protein